MSDVIRGDVISGDAISGVKIVLQRRDLAGTRSLGDVIRGDVISGDVINEGDCKCMLVERITKA